MASYKLPSFKVTQKLRGGRTVHRTVPRGGFIPGTCDPDSNSSKADEFMEDDSDQPTGVVESTVNVDHIGADISLHAIKEQASARAWQDIRSQLCRAAVESSAMPEKQQCIMCTERALCRCCECGSNAYYCQKCFKKAHTKVNIFHVGEIWQDGMFKYMGLDDIVIDVHPQHNCSSKTSRSLCCIDGHGIEHNVNFIHCDCESLLVTMVRARLWPATPQFPRLAFCFELFDLAEALLLECQVALKDLCAALRFKGSHFTTKGHQRDYYAAMIDSFEEYRCMRVELRHMHFICSDLDNGNVCPACPKESGSLFLSMDALFGLPRKKAAGKSHREPIHGHFFFGDQVSLDEFVVTSAPVKISKSCSDFAAGDALRSAQRYHALEETAVFGSACRHEFPYLFVNLKHGERIAYAVWLLDQISQRKPADVELKVMYDIACTLVLHLKKNDPESKLLLMKFAIPAFHAFAHNPSCQVLYSPQRCDGFGLTDGEVMERLWSYLRRFNRMTKEMRPSHRIDILSHALLYYGFKRKHNLASLLVHRWRRARGIHQIAAEKFHHLSAAAPVSVSEKLVKEWIEEEKATVSFSVKKNVTFDWHLNYHHMLESYYSMRDALVSTVSVPSAKDMAQLRERIFRVESQLVNFEYQVGVKQRWKRTDKDYIAAQHATLLNRKEALHSSLRAAVVRRHYLLNLKAKYADGQKIAKRLSKSITKETATARNILDNYNSILSTIGDETYSLQDVLCPDAKFWDQNQQSNIAMTWGTKKDLIQAYLLLKRSEEELAYLEKERLNTLDYWFNLKSAINKHLLSLEPCDKYSFGVVALLKTRLSNAEYHHSACKAAFASIDRDDDDDDDDSNNEESSESDFE